MTAMRQVLKLFVGLLIAVACGYGCSNEREARRVNEAFAVLQNKLHAYKKGVGRFPDSLAALSFTNSATEKKMQEIIQQISYERTESGYLLLYRSANSNGFTQSEKYNEEQSTPN